MSSHRRRLAPEAVVSLDWHNDMSKLILDINDRIEAAADDRARGVVIRQASAGARRIELPNTRTSRASA